MREYKNIKLVEGEKVEKLAATLPRRNLNAFAWLFLILVSLGTVGISVSNFGFADEIKQISSYWAPNLEDIGKLKFVNKDEASEKEASLIVSEMAMPFNSTYVTEGEEGCFVVNGLGSLVVKSCLDGKVKTVTNNGGKKSITISHGKGITSVYEDLDTVAVKEGESVKKNGAIGISYKSEIVLKVLLGGKLIAGLTVKDGEMTFA